jgi:chromosome partitioning protein
MRPVERSPAARQTAEPPPATAFLAVVARCAYETAMKVALVSPKGGVGKTTLATSIAWELQTRGSSVLIVDADRLGSSRIAGEVATERGLCAPSIVALGRDMYRPDQLPRLAQGFDHVVIDTAGELGDVPAAALMVADIALVPISQSGIEVWGNTGMLQLIDQAKAVNRALMGALVFVRKLPNTALGRRARAQLERQTSLPILATETTFRVAWQEAMMAGQGVAQYAPKDKAAAELRALVDELVAIAARDVKAVANG